MPQEDAFETLDYLNHDERIYKVPNNLLKECSTKRIEAAKKNSRPLDCLLCSFKYHVEGQYFYEPDLREFKSLFFEQIKEENHQINFIFSNFFLLKFSESTTDDSLLERDTAVEKILRRGIQFNGSEFNIVGCSNSQVVKKAFIFMKGSRQDCDGYIKRFVPNVKKLQREKGVAKRVKYIGLLFTSCRFIVDLPEFKWIEKKDVETGNYNFTDGCGIISYKLAEEIIKINPDLRKEWKHEIPSVWQIRYYGHGYICKGVLVVDHSERDVSLLTMRKSMLKISLTGNSNPNDLENKLGIVSTSLKANIGKLNKQFIALINANVDTQTLLSIQSEYLESLRDARTNPQATIKSAAFKVKQWSLMKMIFRQRSMDVIPKAFSSFIRSIEPRKASILEEKLQVPLLASRLLFGVCLPEQLPLLQEGQCVVLTEFGYKEGPVIVSRSPSYFPGDIRVLEAVDPHNNKKHPVLQLKNVIIFSSNGKRPDPDKMSGGDLDGDLYLVVWDERLLKFKEALEKEEAFDYACEPTKTGGENADDWLRYVAKWENSTLTQIYSCFFQLARKEGVKSKDCKDLCKIFSQVVDQNPSDMEKLRDLYSKCGWAKNIGNLATRSSLNLPVWDQMLKEQQKLFHILKEREEFPTIKDWRTLYEKIIYKDDLSIDKIQLGLRINERIEKKEISDCIKLWKIMCKGHKHEAIETVQHEDSCTFDCTNKDCSYVHSKDPEFYKENWKSRMKTEITEVVKTTIDELSKRKKKLDKQHKLWIKGQLLEQDAYKEYEVAALHVQERRTSIDNLNDTLKSIADAESTLQILSKDVKKRTLKERFFVCFSTKERIAMEKFSNQKKELLGYFNQSLFEEKELTHYFGLTTPVLVTMNGLPAEKQRMDKMNKLQKLVFQCRRHKSARDPVVRLVPSNASNLKQLLAAEIDCKETKMHYQSVLSTTIENLEKDVFYKEDKLKSLNLAIQSLRMYQIDTELEKLLKSTAEEANIPFDIDLDIKEATAVNKSAIKEEIKEQATKKIEEKQTELEKTELEKENVLKKIDKLKKSLSDLNEDIRSIDKKIQKYESMQVYDHRKMEEAAENYETLSEDAKNFDLALSALLNEVDGRYESSNMRDGDIWLYNQELTFCLNREKARCQRELEKEGKKKLPVFSKRSSILETFFNHDVVVIVAGTGSGKSTQVPQFLADDLHHVLLQKDTRFPKIACTQPRRIAAVNIAKRVALEYVGAVDTSKKESSRRRNPPTPGSDKKNALLKFAAYPLYAALEQDEQRRALDEKDRVGYDKEFCQTEKYFFTGNETKGFLSSFENTVGELGRWVGFQIGSKNKSAEEQKKCRKFTDETRIHFVTEGLLLQKLKNNVDFSHYQCIIVDEAHERGKDTDLLLALLRNAIINNRKNEDGKDHLKVVVMSASIDQKAFSDYFGGCPVIQCDGHMFEVVEEYRKVPRFVNLPDDYFQKESTDSETDSDCSSVDSESDVDCSNDNHEVVKKINQMDRIVYHAVDVLFGEIGRNEEKGDVLIFLPGRREIHLCVDTINKRARKEPIGNVQDVRKVVCCTNIAETSLTIPGVRFVIDGGKAYKMTYDHKLRVSALKLQNSSQAAAKQRKGRAGRVQSGWCYRLYSKDHFATEMPEYDEPELKRCPIDELYLYALDVVGSLEEIQLMPDAQPDEEVIQCGKERLLNFGYIEQENNNIAVTDDGKFALQLTGDLSLEGTRMIIEAQKLGVSGEAIALAVLLNTCLQDNVFQRSANDDVKNSKERKELDDELGDHLTILNIYKHFQEKMTGEKYQSKKKQDIESWCKRLGISLCMLEQVRKSSDSVYKVLKRNKKYGKIIEMQCQRGRKKPANVTKGSHFNSLVEKKEDLLKCVVAGYFHNIVEPHDTKRIRFGYSMITPTNYGSKTTSSERTKLLKVNLERESSLFALGDTRKNTISIFNTLFMVGEGSIVLMKVVSKIKPEWIIEHTSQRWQDSIGLEFFSQPLQIRSYVKRYTKNYIGPKILCLVRNEKVSTKQKNGEIKHVPFVKTVEDETNARIEILFETAEIKFFGSENEVETSLDNVEMLINQKIEEVKQEDYPVKYPNPDWKASKDVLCTITSGIRIATIEKLIEAPLITDWNEIQSGTVIILKCPNAKDYVEKAFKPFAQKNTMKTHCDTEKFAKFFFPSQKIAVQVCDTLKMFPLFREGRADCFLDKEIYIDVIDTDIYPSVLQIASNHPTIQVVQKPTSFKIRIARQSSHRDFEMDIDRFMAELSRREILNCGIIEDYEFSKDLGQKYYIYRQVKKKIREKESDNCLKVSYKKYPIPRIAIYGEKNERQNFKTELVGFIDSLKEDIVKGTCHTITFNRKIPVETRNQYSSMLRHLGELRQRHSNVMIHLYGGNEHVSSSTAAKPVVHLLSDNTRDGMKAEEEILQLLEKDELGCEDEDALVCARCKRSVYLPMMSRQKRENSKQLKEARKLLKKKRTKEERNDDEEERRKRIRSENERNLPEGRRLTLCGCIYCKDCLMEMLICQLGQQSVSCQHKDAVCSRCKQIILMKDLYPLSCNSKEKLYTLSFKNYLHSDSSKPYLAPAECTNEKCKTLMQRRTDAAGVYRCINNQCRFVWCTICGGRVMNRIDFDKHQMCTPKKFLRSMRRNPTAAASVTVRRKSTAASVARRNCPR